MSGRPQAKGHNRRKTQNRRFDKGLAHLGVRSVLCTQALSGGFCSVPVPARRNMAASQWDASVSAFMTSSRSSTGADT